METNILQNNPSSTSDPEPPIKPKNTFQMKILLSFVYIFILLFIFRVLWAVSGNIIPLLSLLLLNYVFAILDLWYRNRFSLIYVYLAFIAYFAYTLLSYNIKSSYEYSFSPEQQTILIFSLIALLPFIVIKLYLFAKQRRTGVQIVESTKNLPTNTTSSSFSDKFINKTFYTDHKILIYTITLLLIGYIGMKIAAGGGPVVSCQLNAINPLGMMSENVFSGCSKELGNKALTSKICSIFFYNSVAKEYCFYGYALQNNKQEICKKIPEKSYISGYCYTQLAVKNKNIRLCNNLSAFSQETCQNEVREKLFYKGPQSAQYTTPQGDWDPCPGNDPDYWVPEKKEICPFLKNPLFVACQREKNEFTLMDCYLEAALKEKNPKMCEVFNPKHNYDRSDYLTKLEECYLRIK